MDAIKRTAEDLIKVFHTREPQEICDQLDILVLRVDLPQGMNGFFTMLMDHRVIYLSRDLSPQKQRQVCAHELGHALFHTGMNRFFIEENTHLSTGRYEREADLFAAYLLIDQDLFIKREEPVTIEELSCQAGVDRHLIELYIHKFPIKMP